MAISRKREYLADASAAELTRNPQGLISALEKIRGAIMPTKAINNGVAHMCITDPRGSLIEEKLGMTADLMASHPPMEKRILALKVMSYQ
jgi:heat shock protein HtpX